MNSSGAMMLSTSCACFVQPATTPLFCMRCSFPRFKPHVNTASNFTLCRTDFYQKLWTQKIVFVCPVWPFVFRSGSMLKTTTLYCILEGFQDYFVPIFRISNSGCWWFDVFRWQTVHWAVVTRRWRPTGKYKTTSSWIDSLVALHTINEIVLISARFTWRARAAVARSARSGTVPRSYLAFLLTISTSSWSWSSRTWIRRGVVIS